MRLPSDAVEERPASQAEPFAQEPEALDELGYDDDGDAELALPGNGSSAFPGLGGEGVSVAAGAFGEAELPPERPVRAQQASGNRVVGFLRGCWAELQRVQWPDRRQVAQATGVVLGFVVVAGLFLGLADDISQKIVNAIL
jgi:preprotein translocase SecE subunit